LGYAILNLLKLKENIMFKKMMSKTCPDSALLVLRLALAYVFIVPGFGKLFGEPGIQGFTGFLTNLSVPAPGFFAWVVALLEFFGGIAILLGVFTRPVAKVFAIELVFIYFLTRTINPAAQNYHIVIFAIALALAFAGGGKYVFRKKKEEPQTM
jgi:putative oxidoreductase